MSETMKKRYEDVSATLCAIHGLKYSHCLTREEAEAIESLLDDLMAERGKKKEPVACYVCRLDAETGGKVWELIDDEDVQISNLRFMSEAYEEGTKILVIED